MHTARVFRCEFSNRVHTHEKYKLFVSSCTFFIGVSLLRTAMTASYHQNGEDSHFLARGVISQGFHVRKRGGLSPNNAMAPPLQENILNVSAAEHYGSHNMIAPSQIEHTTQAQKKHLQAFVEGCGEWSKYQQVSDDDGERKVLEDFVRRLMKCDLSSERALEKSMRDVTKEMLPVLLAHKKEKAARDNAKDGKGKPVETTAASQTASLPSAPSAESVLPALSKNALQKTYTRMVQNGELAKNANFEKCARKKNVRSNSGVVVITVVTAPGEFSCPADCHYCPNEPGQPRSYLSTEPAVARANQNRFCAVRQFFDRAAVLAKQGHIVDKVEIIVLGGTWSYYPVRYQEDFCRDLFYAANLFDEERVRNAKASDIVDGGSVAGTEANSVINQATAAAGDEVVDLTEWDFAAGEALYRLFTKKRERRDILSEQTENERAKTKIIGLTLETRPDHINRGEVRRLRRYGCTRVQIGVQHTDDQILEYVNRGSTLVQAQNAVALLKNSCFKVDIHLMPDLPSSSVQRDLRMFDFVLHTDKLQADHWKIYPCEVTPFTRIEQWYAVCSRMC